MVLRDGMGLTLTGILLCALASMLEGIGSIDPLSFAGVAMFQCLVALLACCLPARRATRVEPMTALRCQ